MPQTTPSIARRSLEFGTGRPPVCESATITARDVMRIGPAGADWISAGRPRAFQYPNQLLLDTNGRVVVDREEGFPAQRDVSLLLDVADVRAPTDNVTSASEANRR